EYMQDSAFDRAYIPQSEASAEFLDKVPVTRTTLAESLIEQIHFLNLPERELALAEFLIGSLDDRGWPATPLPEAADATRQPPHLCERGVKAIPTPQPV